MSTNTNMCQGCVTDQPNQTAHMDLPYGCLCSKEDKKFYMDLTVSSVDDNQSQNSFDDMNTEWEDIELDDDEDEVSVARNLNIEFDNAVADASVADASVQEEIKKEKIDHGTSIAKPIFALPCGVKLENCAICLDDITEMVNITVTTCGHIFHSSCMFQSIDRCADCPLCRHELVDTEEEDDDEEDEEEEEEDEEEGSEGSEENNEDDEEDNITSEQLSKKLQSMGYTMTDIIHQFIYSSSNVAPRYTEEFQEKMDKDIEDILEGIIPIEVVSEPRKDEIFRSNSEDELSVQEEVVHQTQ